MAAAGTMQRVEALLFYFDEDRDGRLSKAELGALWALVANGQKLSKAQYAAACARVGARQKEGLDVNSLHKLYEQGFANLEEHFQRFLNTRELPDDAQLRQQLKAVTKSSCAPQRIDTVAHLGDGSCVVLSFDSRLFLLEEGSLKSLDVTPDWIASVPPEAGARLLVLDSGEFQLLEIDRRAHAKVVRRFGGFPEAKVKIEEDDDKAIWDACLGKDGVFHLVALAQLGGPTPHFLIDDEGEDGEGEEEEEGEEEGEESSSDEEEPPLVYPEPEKWRHLVTVHAGKRLDICQIPFRSSMVSLSPDGLCCAYCVLVGEYEEEANRGEWYVCELSKGSTPRKISQGPLGRVAEHTADFSSSGTRVVYQANHTDHRPITQHMDLWLVDLQTNHAPVKLTPGSMQIEAFCWVGGRDDALWLSVTSGHELGSFILHVETRALTKVEPAAAFECLPSWSPLTDKCAYPVESLTDFEALWDEASGRVTRLPGGSCSFEDIHAEVLQWEGPAGEPVFGAVYHCGSVKGENRTLLVWVHGGPTCAWPILRGNFANDDRAGEPNFTALLRAGYLLLVPLYRGTLGFGDRWSMASIGCQGSREGDLGDILAGVARMRELRLHGCGASAGIFGESYGGYLTIKALSDGEGAKVFQCGAALYCYVNNRETTLVTGDPTFEEEFIGSTEVWPPPLRAEDCHNDLGCITSPLLLMHGDDDECCPVSHSMMVHGALRQRGVATELVIYPGQGHGFEGAKVQRDVNWRLLQWFLRHLPPDGTFPQKVT